MNETSAARIAFPPAPSANGEARKATPRKGRKPAAKTAPAAVQRPVKADPLGKWCHGYVLAAGAASCGLNALAFGQHAAAGLAPAAWALGVFIPCAVLALGKVGSVLYLRGAVWAAGVLALIASALLLLSVWHCTESIAELTGSPVALAAALAVGIDAGMVACEVAATLYQRRK